MTYAFLAWAFIKEDTLNRLKVVQDRVPNIIVGSNTRSRIKAINFNTKIAFLKSYIRSLTLQLHASAKTSRNMYIRKRGSAWMVSDSRFSKPLYILRKCEGVQWWDLDVTRPIPEYESYGD